jgi:hypothetical protein
LVKAIKIPGLNCLLLAVSVKILLKQTTGTRMAHKILLKEVIV